ncbi:hypothetical protein [Herbiconiux sp.]|uniref:hypothetical protein n=1 Tax=Herbiconiux sp. TaxID=1871186 RepID=UPI0025C04DED|nr:hypothetical protein [Herbiconiux sp.]
MRTLTTTRLASIRLAAIPLVLVPILCGCTDTGGTPMSPAPTTAAAPAPASAGPLDPYLSVFYGRESEKEKIARDVALQNAVAACMKKEGFDYQPDLRSTAGGDELAIPFGTEEFARTYGYGVSSGPFRFTDPGASVDPNQEYVNSLSEGERSAYDEALWGLPQGSGEGVAASGESADASHQYEWSEGGCMGAADHELGSEPEPDDPELQSLLMLLEREYEKAEAAPAVLAADEAWSECMAEAGHPEYEKRNEAASDFDRRYGELLGPDGEEPDPAALDALQSEEIAVATADFECGGEDGYAEALAAEQLRVERSFVEAHREELDALVARIGS